MENIHFLQSNKAQQAKKSLIKISQRFIKKGEYFNKKFIIKIIKTQTILGVILK